MEKNKVIRIRDLTKMLCISRATLWRMQKRGDLPPKIRISQRLVGWRRSDIEAWLNSREIDNSVIRQH